VFRSAPPPKAKEGEGERRGDLVVLTAINDEIASVSANRRTSRNDKIQPLFE